MKNWMTLDEVARHLTVDGHSITGTEFLAHALDGAIPLAIRLSGITKSKIVTSQEIKSPKDFERIKREAPISGRIGGVFRLDRNENRLFLELAYQGIRTGVYPEMLPEKFYISMSLSDDPKGPCMLTFFPAGMTAKRLFAENEIVVLKEDLTQIKQLLSSGGQEDRDRQLIALMEKHGGVKTRVAEEMGISRTRVGQLLAKMEDQNKRSIPRNRRQIIASDPFGMVHNPLKKKKK